MRILATAALVLAACSSAEPSALRPQADITVFAGSSLTDVFNRLGGDFRTTDPSVRFRFNFGSSSTLATQIVSGAPADVFASADEDNMAKVTDAGMTDGTAQPFAGNRLEIAVAPGNPKRIAGPSDLARPDVVLVLAAPTVPAGKYALEALKKAGLSVRPVSQEIDVRAVLNKVALGEADAGIVYVTDVRSAGGRVSGVDIPATDQVTARYPVVVIKGTKVPELAHRFVDYVLSAGGQQTLASFGFSSP